MLPIIKADQNYANFLDQLIGSDLSPADQLTAAKAASELRNLKIKPTAGQINAHRKFREKQAAKKQAA